MAAEQAAAGEGAHPSAGHWLNEERVRVYSWMIVVIFAVVYVGWLARSLPDLVDPRGKPFGYDFMAYWSAARLALAGRPEAAFDEYLISAVQHEVVPSLPGIIFPWHYPPTFLLPVTLLGLLPYAMALAAFVLGTAALWAALVRRVLPDRRAWIVAAAAPAGLINLLDGQNAFLTAALIGFALLWLERRPIAAGILIGLLAIKPHLAALVPLALLAEGRWRSIAAAALTALALAAASLAAFGWPAWAAFLHHLPVSQAMANAGAVPWGTMPSPYVFALALGGSVAAASALQIAVALFAAGVVWRAWRNRAAPFEAKAATLVAASLLVSPYLFYYDLLWAALAVAWLGMLGLKTGFRRGEREILLFAWLAPALMPPVFAVTNLQLGFPAVLLLLVAAVRRAAPLGDAERRALRSVAAALREARWVRRERLLRWGTAFAIMSLALLALHVVSHTTVGIGNGRGDELGNDFINFWSGARLAATGEGSLAYDPGAFQAFEQAVTGPSSSYRIYVYPPTAMLLSLPLALFSFVPALALWSLAGAVLCFLLLRRLAGGPAAALLSVGAPSAFLDLLSGQNGHFTAALLGGGMMLLPRRPVLAGVLFGLFAYKPQMAVLLPFALAAGGCWRAFAAAAIAGLLLMLASWAVFGGGVWAAFLDHVGLQAQFLESYTAFWHRMPTVFVAGRVVGAGLLLAYAAQLVSAALAIAAVVAVWRADGPFAIKAATLIVATFLATPHAFDYDTVVLVFAAIWLAREGLRTGFLAWERIAVVALLALPLPTMVATRLLGLPIGPVVLWLVLAVLLRRGRLAVAPDAAYRPARPIGLVSERAIS